MLTVCVFILGSFNMELLGNDIKTHIGETHIHYGKVVSIEYSDKNYYKLVIDTNNGEKVLISIYENLENHYDYYGCFVSFSSNLKMPEVQRNPGCFDYKLYLRSIGIIATGTTSDIKVLDTNLNLWQKFNKHLLIQKEQFINFFENEKTKGFVSGILFGDKDLLRDDIYEEFKENGTAHILAVSGLHIGVLYGLLEKVLGKKQTRWNFVMTSASLIFLGCIASWTSSVTRALGMVFLKMIAKYTDRRYDILTSMSVVALISIVINPYVVYNTGFQMSYLAVVSIAFVMPHIPKCIPDFMAIIIAVNFGLIPYQMYQFNTFSFTAFFANIPIVYLSGIIMPIIAVYFGVSLIGTKLSLIEMTIDSLSHFIVSINKWCTLGIGSLDVISPPLWLILAFYFIAFFLISEQCHILFVRKKYVCVMVSIGIMLAGVGIISYVNLNPISNDKIVFIDVGQGDALHIRDGKRDVLIDGGGKVDYNIGKNTLKPYLLKNGTSKVELAFATHKHTDHYKGLEELCNEGMIEQLLTRRTAGQKYYLSDDIYIETLWPLEKDINSPSCPDPDQEENKYCSIFMVHYKGERILVTGDIDDEGEKRMVQHYKGTNKLKADILKVGHHGSQYSTCDEFLDVVNPKFCVIQVGKNNYGHPHMKIIEKCHKKGIIILRNDLNGAIGFSIKDGILKYNVMIKDNQR